MILTAENLRVRYRNGALGIDDVSISVDEGEVITIFGPNGAGKTTTVRAISGFSRSEGARVIGGTVQLFGRRTTNFEPQRTANMGLGFVPERQKIFGNLSVLENLSAVGRRPSRRHRKEMFDRIYTLFPDLASRRREPAGRLSGGQQQMLAIGRSLMSGAKLLIIDELTLGLHHNLHGPLYEVVRSIASEGSAVVIVDESTGHALKAADRCYLMAGGRVRKSGPAESFEAKELLSGYVNG